MDTYARDVGTRLRTARGHLDGIVRMIGSQPGVARAEVNFATARARVVANPMIAGAAMAFSSVSVVLNSLRLRRFAA